MKRTMGVALLVCAGLSTRARAEGDQIQTIPAGQRLMFAAEVGTTPEILGQGFDRDLHKGGRVYAAKYKTVADKRYKADVEMIDNSFVFEAYGRYLFATANVKATNSKRYMVVRAYSIDNVIKLDDDGPALTTAPMYASKIFQGWAVYIVIEGDAATFTADVAAKLTSVVGVGGSLKALRDSYRLETHVTTVGLSARNPGEVFVANGLKDLEKFTTAKPQPILVEYTLQKDIESDAIDWERGKPAAEQIKVRKLTVEGRNSDWVTTGLVVDEGDLLVGTAEGAVKYSFLNTARADSKGSGGLQMRVGNEEFPAGPAWTHSGAKGEVKLRVRDHDFGDNHGSYSVVVRVIPRSLRASADCQEVDGLGGTISFACP